MVVRMVFKLSLFLLVFSSRGMGTERGEVDKKLAQQEGKLARIREELIQKRREARQLEKREGSLLSQLEDVEKRLELSQTLISGLVKKERLLRSSITRMSENLMLLGESLDNRRARWSRRLRGLYKRGRVEELELLFSSQSLPQLLSRGRVLSLITHQDEELLRQLRAQRETIWEEEEKLKAERLEVEKLKGEREKEKRALKADYHKRQRLLERIRTEKANYARAIRDLELSSEEIQRIIDELQKQRKEFLAKSPFAARKGYLPWPVEGEVVSKFGRHLHPIFKTVTFSGGVDIRAALGAEVRSVFAGRVLYEGWLRGYGRFLILGHGSGYYTLYAHLSQVLVDKGDEVEGGEPVALVGESGSVSGPQLHFELRKERIRLDPLKWLEKREKR